MGGLWSGAGAGKGTFLSSAMEWDVSIRRAAVRAAYEVNGYRMYILAKFECGTRNIILRHGCRRRSQ